MTVKNIALMAGGFTGEFEVSLNSAKNIAQNLDNQRYNVYTILVETGSWYYLTDLGDKTEIDKNDFSIPLGDSKINFDAAFITIHGTPGEDGKLQGYFDMLKIPYTTCDAATSAITMNKAYTKAVVGDIAGLKVARSMQLFKNHSVDSADITQKLSFPLFIKPNNGGSSVGMSKVNRVDEIMPALEKAFEEDDQLLIEEFIKGREFSIGLYKFDGKITVLPPTEIISSKEFFDYEAKYTPGITEEVTPADLSFDQNEKIAQIVTEVYKVLNCKGMCRVDFIIHHESKEFYFIEINTTPGQSVNSIYPQQLRAAGIDIGNFYAKLIEEAVL